MPHGVFKEENRGIPAKIFLTTNQFQANIHLKLAEGIN